MLLDFLAMYTPSCFISILLLLACPCPDCLTGVVWYGSDAVIDAWLQPYLEEAYGPEAAGTRQSAFVGAGLSMASITQSLLSFWPGRK